MKCDLSETSLLERSKEVEGGAQGGSFVLNREVERMGNVLEIEEAKELDDDEMYLSISGDMLLNDDFVNSMVKRLSNIPFREYSLLSFRKDNGSHSSYHIPRRVHDLAQLFNETSEFDCTIPSSNLVIHHMYIVCQNILLIFKYCFSHGSC